MILRANFCLDAREAELLKVRLTDERNGRMVLVTIGGRPTVTLWVNADDLALVLFAAWRPARQPGVTMNGHREDTAKNQCSACQRPQRRRLHVTALCTLCWAQLPIETRCRLVRRDADSANRLFQLLSALRRDVPLCGIEVVA